MRMYTTHSIPTRVCGTYRIETYGCQMNAHESEKIAGMLEQIGLVEAEDGQPEDVRVLNTCCIRDSAEQRIIGRIGTLKAVKRSHPNMVIAVVGCLTAQADSAEKIRRTFPFVDVILGTSDTDSLPVRVAELLGLTTETVAERPEPVIRRSEGPLAFVNIMRGCNNFCSYCIVPFVRGRECSRSESDIVDEVALLCDEGYRDVTLLGQNVNSYQGGGEHFAGLLKRISDETSIDRIRFMTSHPKDMSQSLIQALRHLPRLCPQVHLPVQSGSNRILASMNRRYTREHYLGLVDALRSAVPDIVLTTDVIVGYPGEQISDFKDTISLMETVRFDGAYTFVYSPRKGTRAASMCGQVRALDKKNRIVELINVQNEITGSINSGCVGRVEEVLVEGPSARGSDMCGRTPGGKLVNFAASDSLRGSIIDVRITESRGATLYGTVAQDS